MNDAVYLEVQVDEGFLISSADVIMIPKKQATENPFLSQ